MRIYVLQLQILAHGELYELVLLKTDLGNHHGHTVVYVRVPQDAERMQEEWNGEGLETKRGILRVKKADLCHSFCDTLSTLQALMIFIPFQPNHKINCLSFILPDTPGQYLAYMYLSNYQAFSEQITECVK